MLFSLRKSGVLEGPIAMIQKKITARKPWENLSLPANRRGADTERGLFSVRKDIEKAMDYCVSWSASRDTVRHARNI